MMKQNNIDKIEEIEDKIEETIERPVKRVFSFLRIDEDRQQKISEDIKGHAESDLTYLHVRRLADILVERLGNAVNLTINVMPTYEVGKDISGGN